MKEVGKRGGENRGGEVCLYAPFFEGGLRCEREGKVGKKVNCWTVHLDRYYHGMQPQGAIASILRLDLTRGCL